MMKRMYPTNHAIPIKNKKISNGAKEVEVGVAGVCPLEIEEIAVAANK